MTRTDTDEQYRKRVRGVFVIRAFAVASLAVSIILPISLGRSLLVTMLVALVVLFALFLLVRRWIATQPVLNAKAAPEVEDTQLTEAEFVKTQKKQRFRAEPPT